jgi:hypothetical protein
MDECKVIGRELVIARCHTPSASLHQVAHVENGSMSLIGRFCCKSLCSTANAQLSNPTSQHLDSDIARFGSSLINVARLGSRK